MSSTHDTLTHPGPEDSSELDLQSVSAELVAGTCLVGVNGKAQGSIFLLLATETLIGRAASANIVIDDKALSSRHAKIVWNGERHLLSDLGSTNGTFLNGQQLVPNEPVPIAFGDTIQVANTQLTYTPNPQHDQTQALAPLARPQPHYGAGLGGGGLNSPDAELIVRLLQGAAPEPESKGPTLDDQIDRFIKFWAVVKRNGVALIASTALLAAVANASVFVKPPSSEATFTMRLTPKRGGDDPLEREYDRHEDFKEFYTTAQQNFLSTALIENTLKSLGEKKPSKGQISTVLGTLKFEGISLAVYQGSYKHSDPAYAVRFLSQHVTNYLDTEIGRTIHVIQSEVNFLEGRLKENEASLRKTEEELQAFKSQHIDGLPEYAQEHFASRETLLTRRADLSAQLSKKQGELALKRRQLAEAAPLAVRQAARGEAWETSINDVKRQLSDARAAGLLDGHPKVEALTKQLKLLEAQAAQASSSTKLTDLDRSANPGLIELKNQVGALEVEVKGTGAELGAVNGQLARISEIMGKQPEVEARYSELTRSYAANQDLHKRLFERLRTSQLQLELERTSAAARYEIISRPESSGVPLQKALIQRTAIGVGLGLVLGVAIALLSELRRFLQGRKARKMALVAPGTMTATRGTLARRS